MPSFELTYPLHDNFIHNWLIAGPLQTDLNLEQAGIDFFDTHKIQTLSSIRGSGVTIPPVDLGNLGTISEHYPQLYWRYYRCGSDHFVNLSQRYELPKFVESWAYCKLQLPAWQKARFQMAVNSSAELWINGQQVDLIYQKFPRMMVAEIEGELAEGENSILIRHYQAGFGDTASFLALKALDIDPETQVKIPVELERDQFQKRINLEKVAEAAYLDQYVFGYPDGDRYNRNESIPLRFLPDLKEEGQLTYRMQGLDGSIFQEMTQHSAAGKEYELAKIFPLRSGPHHLAISPIAGDYYQKHVQFQRKDYFYVVRTGYSAQGEKKDKQHLLDALDDAGQRRNESVFCEIAKMALGQWDKIHWEYVHAAVKRIQRSQVGNIYDVIGLLGILGRFWKKKKIPADLMVEIPEEILRYDYSKDEGASSSEAGIPGEFDGLLFTCGYLAGQLFPEHQFISSNLSGRQLQAQSESHIKQWIHAKFTHGFREWDSAKLIESILTALSHLVDLAHDDAICEMAVVLMDKIFFTLATNSFYGAFGSTHGSSDTASVLSCRLSPITGISRLMWGMGNYNDHVMGVVSLACCKKYRLPAVIRRIAMNPSPVLWNLERHELPLQAEFPGLPGEREVFKVTYRTRDFMLSSAQDYAPGKPGKREHIWQATLGPDAVVFVNHPFITDESDIPEPNMWVGNHKLPRVAQWGDFLFAFYQVPENDWLGYTHAYFPLTKFDEFAFTNNWAFARKDEGYLALSALNGFELVKTGKSAYRELRSNGQNQVWICQMGHTLLDRDFQTFQAKVLAMDCQQVNGRCQLRNVRGDSIEFGWEGAFLVNGQEMPLKWEKHIQNQYCIADHPASQIDIISSQSGIRLKI